MKNGAQILTDPSEQPANSTVLPNISPRFKHQIPSFLESSTLPPDTAGKQKQQTPSKPETKAIGNMVKQVRQHQANVHCVLWEGGQEGGEGGAKQPSGVMVRTDEGNTHIHSEEKAQAMDA